jgi:hypothetical protein
MTAVDDAEPADASRRSEPSPKSTHQLIELTREECLELLRAEDFGRVVLTSAEHHIPVIRPVNYRFDVASQSVVFRTGEGTKFDALARAAEARFEIDGVDRRAHTGWSVIISGVTEEVTRPSDVKRLDGLGVISWAPGDRGHWIRVKARTVSGRRILLGG